MQEDAFPGGDGSLLMSTSMRFFWNIVLTVLCVGLLFLHKATGASTGLERLHQDFLSPPDSTRPGCYWYWFDDDVSKEGITRDLEAMKRVGIGTAMIGIIGGVSGKKASLDPKPLTDAWWENIVHAVKEASRIGVDIGVFNCPGWSQSGGPWIRPEQSMRYLAQTEIRVNGPRQFKGKLTSPGDNFQQVAVQAFPIPTGDRVATIVELKDLAVRFEMPNPFTARSLTICPAQLVEAKVELKSSDDGVHFRTVYSFTMARKTLKHGLGPVFLAPVTVTFPAVTARFFRLDFTPEPGPGFSARNSLGQIELCTTPKVSDFAGKSMIKAYDSAMPPFSTPTWPRPQEPDRPDQMIRPQSMVDLTEKTASDGTLSWDVPPGEWLIQRTGMLPTGTKNKPAPPEATGSEVDKMNRVHLKSHFDAYIGELLKRLTPEERSSWKYVVADSYETGFQNWTDDCRQDFQKHYGYDPLPFFPVLSGRPVLSAEASDRFLWDLRRLVAERIARDYVGALRDLCHQNNLRLWLENYGHFGFPSEFLLYGGYSDEIGGEFWMGSDLGGIEVRAASSAAHIYGKPIVWSEAFTSRNLTFRNTPRELKAKGDWSFCEGINQFILHVYIHQPKDDRKPGINAWFGTEFNRNNTWFDHSKPWIDYLRRCSVMLQAGHPAADILRYIGEDSPKMVGPERPEIPAGHDYDCINADAILNRLSVKGGRFYLPDGTNYALMVLPDSREMRPAVLKRIGELVAEGGKVAGPPPERSPSLQNYPSCDTEVKRLARSLWDNGKIFSESNLADVLARLGVKPAVIASRDIRWKQRSTPAGELFFISNPKKESRKETISFRAIGQRVSLWHPDSGLIEEAESEHRDGRTEVSLDLPPAGSVFVMIGDTAPPDCRKRQTLASVQEITGPWNLGIAGRNLMFDKLLSWTESSDPEIRFHSGSAIYSRSFEMTDVKSPVHLDLGRVESLATVTLNGKTFPTLWKYPYRLDVSSCIRPGKNEISVEITNTWNNRLVGDAGLPPERQKTSASYNKLTPQSPLQPAGLMGPVRLLQAKPDVSGRGSGS